MRRQTGFTLIEVLVVLAITSTLLTLGAAAVRHYWFQNAIEGAAEEVQSELRLLQQKTVADSHPMVYGAWFKTGSGSDQWGVLKFDPKDTSTSSDDECTQLGGPRKFGTGIEVSAVDFDPPTGIGTVCDTTAPSGSEEVFFYARGTATAGQLTLFHPQTGRSIDVTVSEMTGRVEKQ